MRILLINSICGRQSTGRIVSDIQAEIINSGNECIIAYGERKSLKVEGNYHIGTEFDRYYHAAMSRIFDCQGQCSKKATRKLIEFIQRYKPDLINIHNIHGYYLNYEILFSFLKDYDKPIVWTLHDCWAFTGHCSHFDYIKCDRWKRGCNQCPQKREYPASLLFDSSKNNYKRKKNCFTQIKKMVIVTPSFWLSNLVKDSFLGKYETKVIHNGIDLLHFKPLRTSAENLLKLEEKKIVLGVASIWSKKKGIYDLVELQNELGNEYQVVAIGKIPKEIKDIRKKILVIESTDNFDDLAKWYNAAYVFVNPTYEDTFPTVNMEALACGTPVITYQTGGSVEMIKEETGAIIQQGNIRAIGDYIKQHSFDSITCASLGAQNDKNSCVKKYVTLFSELVNLNASQGE